MLLALLHLHQVPPSAPLALLVGTVAAACQTVHPALLDNTAAAQKVSGDNMYLMHLRRLC